MSAAAHTLEVRWFLPGPLPPPVSDWFLHARIPPITESRTDLYLAMPGRDDIGVKVRAGDLVELKLRTGVHAQPGLTEGFHGRVESWSKWGCALHPAQVLPGEGCPEWVRVQKKRRSRFYEVVADEGSIRAVASMDLPADSGCTAELVEVRVGGEVAWGVGFEAFGAASNLARVLVAGMNACVAETPLGSLEFSILDSYGYPALLSHWPLR
jgi:hypothetical protein